MRRRLKLIETLSDFNIKDDVNRYSKLSVVYDSISGGSSKVLLGWDTHPFVSLNWPGAYNVSFNPKR
ncbi:hypothetical protein OBV_27250 [Oscillibacter valericigenes Sjm18-20]|nr:hypothetical protein OBV_27250 [Oscillibacter valericigenes Sjm18-20]